VYACMGVVGASSGCAESAQQRTSYAPQGRGELRDAGVRIQQLRVISIGYVHHRI
jgi:hypothetical protein